MPNARTHDVITVVTAAAGTPALLYSGLPDMSTTHAAVLITSYLASGLLFSPDLDLKSRPYRRWRTLRFVWLPYQHFVPHRSWVSHSLMFGPVIRVLYFAGVMSLLTLICLGLVRLLVPFDPTGTMYTISFDIAHWLEIHPIAVVYSAAGFLLGGASHTLTDTIWSGFKRRVRRIL